MVYAFIQGVLFSLALALFSSCGAGLFQGGHGQASVGAVASNGDGTKTVTLNGNDFTAGITVTVNGFNCANVHIVSSTQLTCILAETVELQNISVNYPSNGGGGGGSGGAGGGSLTFHTIFATSTTPDGNLGGISGADTICATRAVLGSKTSTLSGTWKAIVSTATVNAKDHLSLTATLSIKNTNGEMVLGLASDLWGATLLNPVKYNENGTAAGANVWTGTDYTGVYNNENCSGWTSSNAGELGGRGGTTNTNATWIDAHSGATCNLPKGLYCINSN